MADHIDPRITLHPRNCLPTRDEVLMDLLPTSGTETHYPFQGDATDFSCCDQADVAWRHERLPWEAGP